MLSVVFFTELFVNSTVPASFSVSAKIAPPPKLCVAALEIVFPSNFTFAVSSNVTAPDA